MFRAFEQSTTTPKKGGLDGNPERVEIMNGYLTQTLSSTLRL